MTAPKSRKLRIWRFTALGLGILWLLWLPFEDTSERLPIVFAIAICSLVAARILISPLASKYSLSEPGPGQSGQTVISRYLFYAVIGLLAGAGITLVALILMAFKTGLHGHVTPDYTIDQVIAVVRLTPFWVLAGILISVGLAMWPSGST